MDCWISLDVSLVFRTEAGFAVAGLDGTVAGAGLARGLGLANALDGSGSGSGSVTCVAFARFGWGRVAQGSCT